MYVIWVIAMTSQMTSLYIIIYAHVRLMQVLELCIARTCSKAARYALLHSTHHFHFDKSEKINEVKYDERQCNGIEH